MSSPHHDHLKHLLDQRTTRADLPGRASTFSQVSDAPSIYSHTFSPRLIHNGPVTPSTDSRYTSPYTPMSGCQNSNRLHDPTVSMLDLDEDPRLSIASSDYYGNGQQSVTYDDDDEPLSRMSLLGPKMRFHSRAPWELEEDTLQEEDEPDYDSFLSAAKKGFGFSSPRPSGESSRSQVNSQRSFETPPSQKSYNTSAPHTLPQDLPTSLNAHHGTSHIRPGSPITSRPSSPISFDPDAHLPNFADTASLERGRTFTSPHPSSTSCRRSSSSSDVHPYANPELASHAYNQQPVSNEGVWRTSDSMVTVTDSIATSSVSKMSGKHAKVPELFMSSTIAKNKTSIIHGKEISLPLTVHNPSLRSSYDNDDIQSLSSQQSVMGFPGWTDRGAPPTFGLISLEEARAQRSRTVTADSLASRPSFSTQASSSAIYFPNSGHGRASVTSDHSGYGQDTAGTRVRSVSAGSKAKSAFHTIVGGQPRSDTPGHEPVPSNSGPVPGKTLRHKKSGFMRLFNGARQDKEEKAQPPPVPPLSDVYATFNVQQAPRAPIHRVPVPELVLDTGRTIPQRQHSSPPDGARSNPSPPSPRRPLPSLSIDTLPQNLSSRQTIPSVKDVPMQTNTFPAFASGSSSFLQDKYIPRTAPAYVSEFPALKLRPISTMFSSQFGDHIINEPRPSLDTDFGTPDSSSNILSPITPNSSTRFELSNGENTISNDQTPPQERIAAVKLAWQRQIWELECQVKDLKAEMEELRASSADGDYCHACGRGDHKDAPAGDRPSGDIQGRKNRSMVNRPRARTGTSARFASAVS